EAGNPVIAYLSHLTDFPQAVWFLELTMTFLTQSHIVCCQNNTISRRHRVVSSEHNIVFSPHSAMLSPSNPVSTGMNIGFNQRDTVPNQPTLVLLHLKFVTTQHKAVPDGNNTVRNRSSLMPTGDRPVLTRHRLMSIRNKVVLRRNRLVSIRHNVVSTGNRLLFTQNNYGSVSQNPVSAYHKPVSTGLIAMDWT